MELLYVWINCSKNQIYKRQGINFSPEFNFIVNRQQGNYILIEDTSWKGYKSVFKDEIIENVSAIVGRNGIGKTTLLDYLSSLDCSIPHKAAYDKGYELMKERDVREALCIYIFRDNERITVYHNFEKGFINKTNYKTKNMSNQESYRKTLLEHTDFKDIFKIYITNSYYGSIQKHGISRDSKLDEIALTPRGISTIASSYYNKLLDLKDFMYKQTSYRIYRENLKAWLTVEHFQHICDVIYFNKLIKNNRIENYAVHISTQLSVSCVYASEILDRKLQQDQDKNNLSELSETMNNFRLKIDKASNIVINNLVVNLVFEICLDSNNRVPDNIVNISGCLSWAKKNLEGTSNKEYFLEAIKEIEELNLILQKASEQENVVPKNDLAYDSSLIIDYKENPYSYIKFADFIEKRFSAKHSIVMRYILIGNIGMSSGERAFQNFFSWINLLPQFHSIDPGVPKEMKSTILLLIDEIDLYLHPEWQKKFISILLEEVRNQFIGYNVQIIFATHSPLCLSDVPKENTVYLSGKAGDLVVDDRSKHEQTFGKDLYSLLNDAFYLEDNTMGLFAKKYIDDIIEQIIDKDKAYRKLSLNEISLLKDKIQCIGNDIIKNKLLSMIQNCYFDKKDELEMLYKQQNMIEKRIAELEK